MEMILDSNFETMDKLDLELLNGGNIWDSIVNGIGDVCDWCAEGIYTVYCYGKAAVCTVAGVGCLCGAALLGIAGYKDMERDLQSVAESLLSTAEAAVS